MIALIQILFEGSKQFFKMQAVGHHLQKEALKGKDASLREAYARSAYNRYYYGIYHQTRALIGTSFPEKIGLNHKDLPKFLSGQITKTIKTELKRAQKNGDTQLLSILSTAKDALKILGPQLELAYAIRVVADYKLETEIDFVGSDRFSLQNCDITEAHQWASSTRLHIQTISQALKQINV